MNTRKPVILLAPLDWGLGHTVRCIPIISELLNQECEVIVACNSEQKKLLQTEFTDLRFAALQGYEISYAITRIGTLVKLSWQIPKILTAIKQEKAWLHRFLASNRVDAVISDNRYGLASNKLPCIFITHQLKVRSGLGRLLDYALQKVLYQFINRFTACWVPDWKEKNLSMAGELSHPNRIPKIPVHYIGCLSRFNKCSNPPKPNTILAIVSGPEPQRSIFERIIIRQFESFNGRCTLVRGVFDESFTSHRGNLEVIGHASGKHLNRLLCNAEFIICRSGYTSIMDLFKLGKKAILIPTPGQAEQEYLATSLDHRDLVRIAAQQNFNLQAELYSAQSLTPPAFEMDQYKKYVREFIASLKHQEFQSASADFGNSKN